MNLENQALWFETRSEMQRAHGLYATAPCREQHPKHAGTAPDFILFSPASSCWSSPSPAPCSQFVYICYRRHAGKQSPSFFLFLRRKERWYYSGAFCTILNNILLDTSWSREQPDSRMPCSLCQLSKLMCYPITLSFRMDHYPLQ